MTKFPKLRTLPGDENSKNFFGKRTFPTRFFDPYWPSELCPTREHAKIKKFFLQNAIFHFLLFFPPFFNSTQSEFGRYKREFKHCTPSIKVSLASSISTVPILIPKWGQNTIKNSQDVLPSIPICTPHFRHNFCIFSELRVAEWIF